MRYLYLVIIFTLFTALAACNKNDSVKNPGTSAAEMNPAPDISVISMSNNSPLKLSSLKGKVVILNFWGTWCPPCREEIPSMMKLNSFMVGKPFQMVAVPFNDDKNSVQAYFKQSGQNLPVFLDDGGKAAQSYDINAVPETFIIDKNGIIVKKVIGGIAWDSPEVVAFLEGLMK